jgi:hypothetical protein
VEQLRAQLAARESECRRSDNTNQKLLRQLQIEQGAGTKLAAFQATHTPRPAWGRLRCAAQVMQVA